jgi:two-component system, OmpR family, heavy metal sensor histidine kinase CusS
VKRVAPRSITLRITLLFAAVSATVLLVLGVLVGVLVDEHFEELDAMQLSGRTHALAHIVDQVRGPADLGRLHDRLDEALIGEHGLSLAVWGPDGQL